MVVVLLLLFLLLLFLLLFLLLLLVFGGLLFTDEKKRQLNCLKVKLLGAGPFPSVANCCVIGGDSQSPPPRRLWARRDPIRVRLLRRPQALGHLLWLLLLLLLPVHMRHIKKKKNTH